MLLILTSAERLYIALSFNERALRDVPSITIDVPVFRLRFVRRALDAAERGAYDLTQDELRALDMLLTDGDQYQAGKLPDGLPVSGLITKVWRAMLGGTEGSTDADGDTNNHEYANADDGAAAG